MDRECSRRKILLNRALFQELVSKTLDRCAATSATYAQLAADFAWHNHTGLFTSPELERRMIDIGEGLRYRTVGSCEPASHVLHVLTQAYAIGGHTNLLCRWIRLDRDRTHTVVLTQQDRHKVPSKLLDVAPGRLHRLDTMSRYLVGRALALRKLAGSFDTVCLHVHPYDIVPLIAFGGLEQELRVLFLNHADHVFWLGTSVSQTFINLRNAGAQICKVQRGIPPERHALLPIPLEPVERTLSRAEAKAKLGISARTVLMVSAAVGYKFSPVAGLDYVKTLTPFVAGHPNTTLLVVGFEQDARWKDAEEKTGGRIRVMGRCKDLKPFYEAADIYLDSFPFSSATSLLEAVQYGTPALSLSSQECAVLSAESPSFPSDLVQRATREDYLDELSRLVEDGALRESRGSDMADRVRSMHVGPAWLEQLERIYTRHQTKPSPPQEQVKQCRETDLDLLLADTHRLSGFAVDYETLARHHLGRLPRWSRLFENLRLKLDRGAVARGISA